MPKTSKKATKKPAPRAKTVKKAKTMKATKKPAVRKKAVVKKTAAKRTTTKKKATSTLVWKRTKAGRPRSSVSKRSSTTAKRKRPIKVIPSGSSHIDELTGKHVLEPNGGEIHVGESKFNLGVEQNAGEFLAHNIPFDYGHNRIILLVVDPKFAFLYWEVQNDRMHDTLNRLGSDAKLTLRFRNTDSDYTWDVSIYERVGNWYLKLDHPDQSLMVEIGMKNDRGEFEKIAASNIMRLPRVGLAPKGPIKWMLVSPSGEKVITEIEDYTDADLELLKKIMGPYFFDLLKKGRFTGIVGSSSENVFLSLEEIVPLGISS